MQDYDYWWHKTSSPMVIEALIDFLETIQPDVVHFHHFFTYGADVLTLTRRVLPNARIVFTFHEFMTICAADGHMVRRTDQSLCTHASQIRCHQCFPSIRRSSSSPGGCGSSPTSPMSTCSPARAGS